MSVNPDTPHHHLWRKQAEKQTCCTKRSQSKLVVKGNQVCLALGLIKEAHSCVGLEPFSFAETSCSHFAPQRWGVCVEMGACLVSDFGLDSGVTNNVYNLRGPQGKQPSINCRSSPTSKILRLCNSVYMPSLAQSVVL